MVAAVVVGDLRMRVDQLGHLVEALLGHGDRRERQAAAEADGVVHRAEAGEHLAVEEMLQAPDHVGLVEIELVRDRRERRFGDRDAGLQAVDQRSVDIVDHAAAPVR